MKTKTAVILLIFAIVLPIQNAQSDIIRNLMFGLNAEFGEGFVRPDFYRMFALSLTDDWQDDVYIDGVPGYGDRVLLPYIPGREPFFFGASWMMTSFPEPEPGDSWVGDYDFYLENVFHSTVSIDTGDIIQLEIVGNPTVTGGVHPTITWEAVPGRNVLNYEVRIYGLKDNGDYDPSLMVFRSPELYEEGRVNYSFTYDGPLFATLGPLAIMILANEPVTDWNGPLRNVSNYFIKHPVFQIDIKPGGYPNSINLRSRGVVPVAILSTDNFDANDVDPASCVFSGADPLRWAMEDVDSDGDDDMVLHYKTQELALSQNSTAADLYCETYDELEFIGTDSVNIVP